MFILPSYFITFKTRHFSIVELTCYSWRWSLQINPLNPSSDLPSFLHKVHKVLSCSFTLMSQLASFLLFNLQLLDITL